MKKVCAIATLLCLAFSVFSQRARYEQFLFIDPTQINIVRDGYGVPHIFAKTDAEVAYGLAWAHAEDDFQTIQKCFLASKSMLGLQTGREGAMVDYFVHLLRIRDLVNEHYEKDISDDFKLVLSGYADGFNAYAEAHPKEILEKRSFPITPKDLLTYSLFQLAISCGADDAIRKIYTGAVDLAEWEAEGSNAFAFNGNITADGNTYLAINTHHYLEGQIAWYEAHLHSEEGWNVLGALYPGSPVLFTGVNEFLGWTHTVNHPDKIDVYQLEMNPDNKLQYKVDGQWYTLEESTIKLKVKVPGMNYHTKRKTYWSVYGPTMITEKGVFSIRTAGIMDIRPLEQWYRMNKATSFKEFKSALKMEALPAFNLVYADRYDTIYYLSNGKIPVRKSGFDWKNTVPGNTSATLWNEIHPLEELPQVLNPKCGYVYNTNHSPFKATAEGENVSAERYDDNMGFEKFHNNRSLRVKELLTENQRISYNDFKRIKYDLQLPSKLAFPVNIDTLFLLDENKYRDIADVIRTLKSWDRHGNIESKGATVFAMLFYLIAEEYKKDQSYKVLTEPMAVKLFEQVRNTMMMNFGTTTVPLGEYQRLERGNLSLPLPGLPDVLAAMYASPTDDGRVKGTIGECYIALIKFTEKGPEIETVNVFGTSSVPGSKHYSDQMELFLQQKTKRMTLDVDAIYDGAESVYHPESNLRLPLTARLNRNKR